MAYHIRFFSTAKKPLDETIIRRALAETGSDASLDGDVIRASGRRLADVAFLMRGDADFRDEVARFVELVEKTDEDDDRAKILQSLRTADSLVAFSFPGGLKDDEALAAVDPLIEWLFHEYGGLMQADGEGIYDGGDVVVDLSE